MIVMNGVEMVDVREAAELSRRTPETIRRWVWNGRLAAVKNGNKLFVRRSDVAVSAGRGRGDEPLSLRDWARRLPKGPAGSGVSARDLVLEDRSERAGR
jgi:excisionase family DNA binding protein